MVKVTNYTANKGGSWNSVIAVACENCNHIMVVKTGRNMAAFKSLATLAKEQITECPVCGEKVAIKEKLSVYGPISEHRQAAEELVQKLQKDREEKLHNDLEELIKKAKKREDQAVDNVFAQSLREDISRMKQYLDAVIKLEADSRFLTNRIVAFTHSKYEEQAKAVEGHLDAITKSRRENNMTANKIKALNAEIEKLESEFAAIDWEKMVKVRKVPVPKEPEYLDVTLPAEPGYPNLKKPDATGVYPNEPQCPKLKTALFFNKKKVQEENEQIIAKHESDVAAYRQACEQENVQKLALYEIAMNEYREAFRLVEQKKQKNAELKEEYAQRLKKHKESAISRREKAAEEVEQQKLVARAELDEKIAAIQEKIDSLNTGEKVPVLQLQGGKFFDMQINAAKELLKKVTEELNRLYSVNVIYPTYRELVAVSSFYEYFNSGRCEALEGTHGAYNLFEAECRSDVAARIIRTLEEVKQGQVILYQHLLKNTEAQKELDEAMEKALPHIRKIGQERIEGYLDENVSKGLAAAKKEKADSKESVVAKYFRLAAVHQLKVEGNISEAQKL